MLKYAKAFIATVGAVLVVLNESGVFVDKSWFSGLVAIATALGVYGVANAK